MESQGLILKLETPSLIADFIGPSRIRAGREEAYGIKARVGYGRKVRNEGRGTRDKARGSDAELGQDRLRSERCQFDFG